MLLQYCIHKQTLRNIKLLVWDKRFCFHGNTIIMYLKISEILTYFVARQRMQSVFTWTFMNQVKWKDNMTNVIQINVKYVFLKNYQAHKLFWDTLYIPGGGDRERIALTDYL